MKVYFCRNAEIRGNGDCPGMMQNFIENISEDRRTEVIHLRGLKLIEHITEV